MEKLKKEIEKWKKWFIEDLQKTINKEIEKDVEALFDCLWEKGFMKGVSKSPAVVSKRGGLMMGTKKV